MTGRLKREAASVQEPSDIPRKSQKWETGSEGISNQKLKLKFGKFLERFLKEITGVSCYRPLPPLIVGGQEIDLFELHRAVRDRGGYCSVSDDRLWGSVAVDCGFDSGVGAAVKLVYVKYLDALDRLLRKVVEERRDEFDKLGLRDLLKKLDLGLKAFLSGMESKKSGNDGMGNAKVVSIDVMSGDKIDDTENADEKKCDDVGENVDGFLCGKRKREGSEGMVQWIREVARDPCSRGIEKLPEMHKWKSYGTDVEWKQILWAREAVLLRKNDASLQQSAWQKQKMHPSMYDDDRCTSGRLRCSQRLILAKDTPRKSQEQLSPESSSSGCQNNNDISYKQSDSSANPPSFWEKSRHQKRVAVGQQFQAEVPPFCGAEYENDSKWLGTKTWPLEKGEYNAKLIERDPIGKGRQELCGCQFQGSPKCVKFHVQEKRMKIKLELGPAFYKWKFDGMGEGVALSWTKEDENKFRDIVESNCLSTEKYFWDELFKVFPTKGREVLVSYYFNVFLLHWRSEQNRNGTGNIDSDVEESEYGPVANKFGQSAAQSIFRSPKKPPHSSDRI